MKKNILNSTLIHTSDAITSTLHATSCRPRAQTIAPNLRLDMCDVQFARGAKEPTARRGLNASVPA